MPKIIRIKFQNGINKQVAVRDILNELTDEFIFEESDQPDFILFGPYGNDAPPPGNYVRIGYYCENIQPDMQACEWAFGIPREELINNTRYKRIQWHGLDPQTLVKPAGMNADEILKQKKYFCNFLYSQRIPYREEFFRQLSKYKKIDAPGRSMNNMPDIDNAYSGDIWQRKRQFLSNYKFTIAFENYVYPGYQTEKLYDAMQSNSLPIYCGDPNIGEIFNTNSFINAADHIKTNNSAIVNWLQEKSQPNFKDILPSYHKAPQYRIRRKLKSIGRELKMRHQFKQLDFSPLIDRIIELDQNDNKYIDVLQQPWLINNTPPATASLKSRWVSIFNHNI
ncbi:glycosyltransferase family 10 domain-containing protein [Mucilaginibacter panaciglaebae]|uniref:Fucosyltransferase C-terminal domain-containing protein n=1 Tax=Mucilaginibacter panaciglaebae TaxID=502331 RepID=A0ABP7W9W2_9SPHI